MTKEEKQLLLVDLCARLPYGLLVKTPDNFKPQVVESINNALEVIVQKNLGYSLLYEAKPYLRPMSSMTVSEESRYMSIINIYRCDMTGTRILSEFLDSKMLDWRGLIPRGLALEASEGMYNNQQTMTQEEIDKSRRQWWRDSKLIIKE